MATTTTVYVAPTTTRPAPVHISVAEAQGALIEAFARLLPGYSPTTQDVALFQAQTIAGGDTRLAAVGFVSARYASTIEGFRDQAASREQEHRWACNLQVVDEMMSGTTAVPRVDDC